jgi:2,3-bisphosphoglycerate-independent phosphoglycerate mutase
MVQRDKKGTPLRDDSGRPLPLTSHTLSPVPIAIGGKGLPDTIVFRDDLPKARFWLVWVQAMFDLHC